MTEPSRTRDEPNVAMGVQSKVYSQSGKRLLGHVLMMDWDGVKPKDIPNIPFISHYHILRTKNGSHVFSEEIGTLKEWLDMARIFTRAPKPDPAHIRVSESRGFSVLRVSGVEPFDIRYNDEPPRKMSLAHLRVYEKAAVSKDGSRHYACPYVLEYRETQCVLHAYERLKK